jgi:hypothetical protein
MKIGCTYDFRLYSGRDAESCWGCAQGHAAGGAQLAVDLEPVRVADTAGKGTIRWDTGSESGSELYVSTSPRFTGYYPIDSDDAVERLEGLRAKGADFLLFPRMAFWWLDHYQKFREHLDAHYPVVVRDENTCIIFDLRNPPASSVAKR